MKGRNGGREEDEYREVVLYDSSEVKLARIAIGSSCQAEKRSSFLLGTVSGLYCFGVLFRCCTVVTRKRMASHSRKHAGLRELKGFSKGYSKKRQ